MEDVLLAILKPALEPNGIKVHAIVPDAPALPFVVVRRLSSMGNWRGDPRGLYDCARVAVHIFAEDPNGEMKCTALGEIISVILRDAVADHWSSEELGVYVNKIEMTSEPIRMADWATSSGPVQYADLPTGTWRYEAHYSVWTRPLFN